MKVILALLPIAALAAPTSDYDSFGAWPTPNPLPSNRAGAPAADAPVYDDFGVFWGQELDSPAPAANTPPASPPSQKPTGSGDKCQPGTYRCEAGISGDWSICNTEGVYDAAGSCSGTEICIMNPDNNSPYCLPPPPEKNCKKGVARCALGDDGKWTIQTCQSGSVWRETSRCISTQVCEYGSAKGLPHCVRSDKPPTEETSPSHEDWESSPSYEDWENSPSEEKCTPGKYRCMEENGVGSTIQYCEPESTWSWRGGCSSTEKCTYPKEGDIKCVSIDEPLPEKNSPPAEDSPPEEKCTAGRFRCVNEGAAGSPMQYCEAETGWRDNHACYVYEVCQYNEEAGARCTAIEGPLSEENIPQKETKLSKEECSPSLYRCNWDGSSLVRYCLTGTVWDELKCDENEECTTDGPRGNSCEPVAA